MADGHPHGTIYQGRTMRRLGKKMLQSTAILIVLLAACKVLAAGTSNLAVTSTVLSKSNCKFDSAATTLSFGNLDPATSADAIATATVGFVCRGAAPIATFFISDNGGLYSSGGHRMRNTIALTEFLRYNLTLNPVTSTVPKNSPQTVTITGKVLGSEYQGAYAGNYNDTVIVSITP